MKKSITAGAVATLIALVVAAVALAGTSVPGGKKSAAAKRVSAAVTLAVFGDSPYGLKDADVAQSNATPKFVDAVNADADISAVVHIGDLHSGKQVCTRAYDEAIFQMWKGFKKPVVYTPGDNEWADCNKVGQSGGVWNATTKRIDFSVDSSGNPLAFAAGNPLANLLLIRSIFFANPGWTLGKSTVKVDSQALLYDKAHPTDAKFVENVMWEQAGVLFVTVNIPGGSNNDADVWYAAPVQSADQVQEVAERNGADTRWLAAAFARATADKVAGIVIASQADMWDPEKGVDHQAGYEIFVKAIADATKAFGKPVLMINGDSHVYRSDNPLAPVGACSWEAAAACVSGYSIHPSGGYNVTNFHRIVVHGSTAPMEYLKLTVDPGASAASDDTHFGPFSWVRKTQQLPPTS